jgi:hypothetical protein
MMADRLETITTRFYSGEGGPPEDVAWLIAEVETLREALGDALDAFAEASQYKGEYLREKHGDEKELARLRALLPTGEGHDDGGG